MNFADDKIVFVDRKRSIYTSSVGFGRLRNKSSKGRFVVEAWTPCREIFHRDSYKVKQFLFQHRTRAKQDCIAAFIERIEEDLNVRPKSKFYSTFVPNVMLVIPSPWWANFSMKRSLFTILLRAGQKYDCKKDNFEEALYSDRYSKKTKDAVSRFMEGHTRYRGRIIGWYNQFFHGGWDYRRPDADKIKKLLVKP